MALFHSTPQTTVLQYAAPPGPSAEETQQRQLAQAIQLKNLENAGYDFVGGQLVKRAPTPQQASESKINELLSSRLQAQLEGRAPEIPAETRALVDQQFNEVLRQGSGDIQRAMQELAGARGLQTTDSPITSDALRAQVELQSRLRGQQAGALLNAGQSRNLFEEQARQFQQSLQERANQNLALMGGGALQGANQLTGLRFNMAPRTQTTTGGTSPFMSVLQPLGAAAGGIGGLLYGGGILGNAFRSPNAFRPGEPFPTAQYLPGLGGRL